MALYWCSIFRLARRELRRWEAHARTIPDLGLRAQALEKLRSERLVAEGAAAFAIFAGSRHRRDVVRACVAYEVMYDFLDALGEEETADVLADNRHLHRALLAALTPDGPPQRFYPDATVREDGGYLDALIAVCGEALARLPTHRHVVPALRKFAERAAEAQSLNHAGHRGGYDLLAAWAATLGPPSTTFEWWELAAGASDPLGVFALVGAASRRETTAQTGDVIESAYFPWLGALVWMLESLVDRSEDSISENHSYVAHYETEGAGIDRFATLAANAAARVRRLPCAPRHAVLLAGVTALYLSHPGAADESAREAAAAVERAVGGPVGLLVAVLRLRRRLR